MAGEADGAVRQGTLTGFEPPESAQPVAATDDDTVAESLVAGATATRRPARAKRATAPADAVASAAALAATLPDDPAQEALAGTDAATREARVAVTSNENAAALDSIEATPVRAPEYAHEAAVVAEPLPFAATPERVEPISFATEGAPPHALAQRFDALQGALAEQRRMVAASSRHGKWVLAAASAAVLASVGFGIAQSVRLDSLANESRAEQARLEQFILKQQSTLDDLTQRLATPPAAPVAVEAEAPPAAPARAVAPTKPAPARHAAAHPAHKASAHRAQKATH